MQRSFQRRSFEQLLVELGAPTLARVKPASLFRFHPASGISASDIAAHWDATLRPSGVEVALLKVCPATGDALAYIYRPGWLQSILAGAGEQAFLQAHGYTQTESLPALLAQLSNRLCCEEAFPHEIGLFLGYPLADVEGFIQNKGQNYTCCGHWKAYGDPTAAAACFARYRKCEQIYKRLYEQGTPISRLTVAA
ncbi:MAG: DUF3793 family protein [Gemmiger sp.]|nr:DUF3793 family protein [Gemmiger sp.]